MGLFWELLQQSQIASQSKFSADFADKIADRLEELHSRLSRVERTLHDLLELLERRFGEDLNKDGKVG